jgi:hypothetical protein
MDPPTERLRIKIAESIMILQSKEIFLAMILPLLSSRAAPSDFLIRPDEGPHHEPFSSPCTLSPQKAKTGHSKTAESTFDPANCSGKEGQTGEGDDGLCGRVQGLAVF